MEENGADKQLLELTALKKGADKHFPTSENSADKHDTENRIIIEIDLHFLVGTWKVPLKF